MNVPRFKPSQAGQYSIFLTLEGWKAELIWLFLYIPIWFTCPQTVTHLRNVVTGPDSRQQFRWSRPARVDHYNTPSPCDSAPSDLSWI